MESPKSQKSWFARHKVLTVIGVLIALAIIGSVSSGGQKTASNNPAATPTPAESPTVVDAKAFGDEFEANQVAAESKWKGKLVQFTSTISNITDTGLSFQKVTSKEFSLTQISCQIKDKNQVLSLKNGQDVTVKGKVTSQTLGVISIESCEVVK